MNYVLAPGIRMVTDIADSKCYEVATGRIFVAQYPLAAVLGLIVRGYDSEKIASLLTYILPATATHARRLCEDALATLLQAEIILPAAIAGERPGTAEG